VTDETNQAREDFGGLTGGAASAQPAPSGLPEVQAADNAAMQPPLPAGAEPQAQEVVAPQPPFPEAAAPEPPAPEAIAPPEPAPEAVAPSLPPPGPLPLEAAVHEAVPQVVAAPGPPPTASTPEGTPPEVALPETAPLAAAEEAPVAGTKEAAGEQASEAAPGPPPTASTPEVALPETAPLAAAEEAPVAGTKEAAGEQASEAAPGPRRGRPPKKALAPKAAEPEKPAEPKSENMNWYILKVQSNREESIREGLLRRVAIAGLDHFFGEAIVPTEKVTEFKGGKKRVIKRKLYPGYLVVQMEINEDTWFLVRETPGIGDFTGASGHPTPMLPHEVSRILAKQEEKSEKAPKLKIGFTSGERVKINEGTFENFEGEVDSIDETNGRVTVMINIFGRSTPVELEYWQIEAV
jgi:transcriptional antiterminator NusG